MSIELDCPKCNKKLKVPDSLAGQEGKCPGCGAIVRIPVVNLDPKTEAKRPGNRGREASEQTAVALMCPYCSQVLTAPRQQGRLALTCPACSGSIVLQDGVVASPQQQQTSSAEPAEPQWHLVTTDGQQFGPVGESEIIRWIQEDRVKPGSKVWQKGMGDWIPCDVTAPFMAHCRKPRQGTETSDAYGNVGTVRTSGKAIAALVLGIVGLILPVFGTIPALLGLIFGALGMKETAGNRRLQGRGMAIAGLVMGIIGLTLWLVWFLLIEFALAHLPEFYGWRNL